MNEGHLLASEHVRWERYDKYLKSDKYANKNNDY